MADEIFEEVYKFNGYKDWQHQIIEALGRRYVCLELWGRS